MTKDELRQKYKTIRRNIIEREEKNKRIAQNLCTSEIWQKAEVIALYLSFGSEAGTEEIVRCALAEGKIIAVPVTDNESFRMDFYRFDLNDDTAKSKLGMAEPQRDKDKLIAPEDIDLCILPGLAFDIFGHRLGMGKGCYDRYLPKLRIDAVKAALCYNEQIMEEVLPHEEFDVDLDYLINESVIIKCIKQ